MDKESLSLLEEQIVSRIVYCTVLGMFFGFTLGVLAAVLAYEYGFIITT